jgi:prepilin-type N-terminal cleavage/methylation domain-containing protein
MIRKMKNKKAYAVSDKLQSERGFTLAELLATIAIMAIVMGVVAGGASSLIKVYKSIRLRADAQTLLSTSVMAVSEEMYVAHDVVTDDTGKVTGFVSDDIGNVTISQGSFTDSDGKTLKCLMINGDNVVASKTQVLGLNVEFMDDAGNPALPTYDKTSKVFTFSVNVNDSTGTIDETQTVKIHAITDTPEESTEGTT